MRVEVGVSVAEGVAGGVSVGVRVAEGVEEGEPESVASWDTGKRLKIPVALPGITCSHLATHPPPASRSMTADTLLPTGT